MTWPTRSDYIERGASVPAWAGGAPNTDLPRADSDAMYCRECGDESEELDEGDVCPDCLEQLAYETEDA